MGFSFAMSWKVRALVSTKTKNTMKRRKAIELGHQNYYVIERLMFVEEKFDNVHSMMCIRLLTVRRLD